MAHPVLSFRTEVRSATIFQWNARGLKSRISDLRQFVLKNRFPILVICEPNVSKPYRLSGYEAFASSTCEERSNVLIYIRTDLNYVSYAVQPHECNQYNKPPRQKEQYGLYSYWLLHHPIKAV